MTFLKRVPFGSSQMWKWFCGVSRFLAVSWRLWELWTLCKVSEGLTISPNRQKSPKITRKYVFLKKSTILTFCCHIYSNLSLYLIITTVFKIILNGLMAAFHGADSFTDADIDFWFSVIGLSGCVIVLNILLNVCCCRFVKKKINICCVLPIIPRSDLPVIDAQV